MTVLGLALATLAAQALPAPGAVRWEELPPEAVGEVWLDPASLRREGDLVRFVIRIDTAEAQSGGARRLVVGMAMDCAGRQIASEVVDGYDDAGNFIETRRPETVAFEPLERSAGQDVVYGRVCGRPAGG